MVNGYVIKPSDLVLRTDTAPTYNPLIFSGGHISKTTGGYFGIVIQEGKAYVGSADELPVFIRNKDGTADILDKPYNDVVLECDFLISGLAILVKNNEVTLLNNSRGLRLRDYIKRVAIGILPNGNALVVMTKATVPELQRMLKAYGVDTALLIASDNIYFSNPRNAVLEGVQPVITLQAKYYEEFPTPIVVLDPANSVVTIDIAKHMLQYLKENYYGTFIITRVEEDYLDLQERVDFVQDIKADFVYTLEYGQANGATRGFESVYYSDTSEASRHMVESIHKEIVKNLPEDIIDRGVFPKTLKRFEVYPCPSMVTKNLYVDNAKDMHLLDKPFIRKLLGEVQGEALASAMGLNKLVEKSRIDPQKNETYYRVNVGRFKLKLGAIELCEQLRQMGFDAYVSKD